MFLVAILIFDSLVGLAAGNVGGRFGGESLGDRLTKVERSGALEGFLRGCLSGMLKVRRAETSWRTSKHKRTRPESGRVPRLRYIKIIFYK